MLLLERFAPGFGWLEVLLGAAYAAGVTRLLADPKRHVRWRRWLWLGFSALFFAQLAIGLAGVSELLMTGELHLPVPALIAAGPLYRGERFFMAILFFATLLLVGPAWCSHLCYLGAWDHEAARRRRGPAPLPDWAQPLRLALLIGVAGSALTFRAIGVAPGVAGGAAAVFGGVGLGVMVVFSTRVGAMVHCIVYCPIGLLASWLGKISPFRLRIDEQCDRCGACSRICRYDALRPVMIAAGRPGLACTLCGDCVPSCRRGSIGYAFLGLRPEQARLLFVTLVASLHALFVACARL
jgi:polyferredoxin